MIRLWGLPTPSEVLQALFVYCIVRLIPVYLYASSELAEASIF